jgi:hypothetical protein
MPDLQAVDQHLDRVGVVRVLGLRNQLGDALAFDSLATLCSGDS